MAITLVIYDHEGPDLRRRKAYVDHIAQVLEKTEAELTSFHRSILL